MKRFKLMSFTFVVLCLMFFSACKKKAPEEIDSGTIENSVFRNKYFGLTVTLPDNWSIQSAESNKEMTEMGTKMVARENKNLEKSLNATNERQSLFLFSAFEYLLGTPVAYNANISCVAERVSQMPGIKRGSDYLFHARKLLEMSQMEVSFGEEITTENLGGIEFDVMSVGLSFGEMVVKQKYFVTLIKGYALSFIVSYVTGEGESSLQSILETVKFN
jgi:hypothetical protein